MNTEIATARNDRRPMSDGGDQRLDLGQAMTASRHTPAPLKPSVAMLAAGSHAGGVSVETAWRIYRAMVGEVA